MWIHGFSGRMGKEIQNSITATPGRFLILGGSTEEGVKVLNPRGNLNLADGLLSADLILDFSSPQGSEGLLNAFAEGGLAQKSILIGTTGHTSKQIRNWRELAKKGRHRILLAPNTSLGVLATMQASRLVDQLTRGLGFDVEILETHHRRKKDSPSGTACYLAESLAAQSGATLKANRNGPRTTGEIGIHSIRGGGVFGEHAVRFLADDEEICISHRAFGRALFAKGALVLGQWLVQQPTGFYALSDVNLLRDL